MVLARRAKREAQRVVDIQEQQRRLSQIEIMEGTKAQLELEKQVIKEPIFSFFLYFLRCIKIYGFTSLGIPTCIIHMLVYYSRCIRKYPSSCNFFDLQTLLLKIRK